jgi:hypothetical protein
LSNSHDPTLEIDDDIKQVKEKFGFNPEEKYVVPQEVSFVTCK